VQEDILGFFPSSRRKFNISSKAWWHPPIIPALGKLRQEDLVFQPGLHNKFLEKKFYFLTDFEKS
jgi:hypothetical protein